MPPTVDSPPAASSCMQCSPRSRPANRSWQKSYPPGPRRIVCLIVVAVLVPAMVALGILCRPSLPAPYQDDYNTILAVAVDYEQMPALQKKLLYIAAAQANEYKLGFEHSIVASEIELTHDLNFGLLNTFGDLFLLPLGYLLWRTYQEDENDLRRSLLAFLPISFFFFSLTYW